MGNVDGAIDYYNRQMTIAHEIGDSIGKAIALWNRSMSLHERGNREQALADAKAALKIFQDVGSPNVSIVEEYLEKWDSSD